MDAIIGKWNSTIDSMTQVYQQKIADYQKQSTTMTEAKKQESQKKIVELEQTIVDFRKEKFTQGTGEVYQKQEQLIKPVKEKINLKLLAKLLKKKICSSFFDKTGDVVLLYADTALT